jgi:phage terminase small subunit
MLIEGIMGGVVRNPAVAQQRDAALMVRSFAREFGLTPSARAGIKVEKGGESDENPFAQSVGGGS